MEEVPVVQRRKKISDLRRIVAFRGRSVGVELLDLGLIEKKHLGLTLEVCRENDLEGFVEFSSEHLDMDALVQHVQKGNAMMSFPRATTLWVVET